MTDTSVATFGKDGPIHLVRRALRFVDPASRRKLLWNAPIALGLAIFEFATMLLLVSFLDAAASREDIADRFEWMTSLGIPRDRMTLGVGVVVAVLFVLKSLLGAWVMWWQFGVATRAGAAQSVETYRRFLSASLRFHAQSDSATGLRDIRQIPAAVVRSILIPAISLVTDGLMFCALALLLVVSDPLTGGVVLVYLGVVGLGYLLLFGDRLRRVNAEVQDLMRDAFARLQDGVRGAEAIQSNQAEDYFIDRTRQVRVAWARARQRSGFLVRAPRFYLEAALVLGITLICLVLFSTSETTEAFSKVAISVIIMFRLLPTLSRALGLLNTMRGGIPALTRMEELDGLVAPTHTSTATTTGHDFRSHIALEGVTVAYGQSRALDEVTIRISRGDRVALLGPSGAGKTTLVDVVLGLLAPDSGRVTVDGHEFTNERWVAWRSLVAYVPQDTFIIDDTLQANITLGSPEDDVADLARLTDAIIGAGLADLVCDLPAGLESRLGDRGQLLSGGQRQRVGLARALYRRAAFIVLDEATSALDNRTQQRITDTISGLPEDVTVLLIAHRLNATVACNRAIVLDHGRVVADGSRSSVLADAEVGRILADRPGDTASAG